MNAKLLVGAALAAALAGTTTADERERSDREHGKPRLIVTKGTVLWNATVVDTRDGSHDRHQVIVIDEGKIRKIARIGAIHLEVRGSAQRINASEKFVVPGYLDMHAHAIDSADKQPSFWPLFIANGITGFRQMSGGTAQIQRAQKLNADSAAGLVDAPEVLGVPGDLFAGPFPPAVAVGLVQQQKAAGATFAKVISIRPDTLFAILAMPKDQGLEVAGHLLPSVSAVESSNRGWRSIEHLGAGYGIVLDCAADPLLRPDILKLPPVPLSPTGVISPYLTRGGEAPLYQRVIDTYSATKCQEVAATMAKNGTWQALTMIRLRTMLNSDDPMFRNDPHLKYVEPTLRALWEQLAQQYAATVPASAAATFRQYYDLQLNMARLLNRNGVPMLAGSDVGGIWVIPGFSLHQEFREMADAGFSPLQILQASTLNGARFLGREATMGTVEEGKNADLVLLDRDPIQDSRNLDKIEAVVLKGKYFSKHALEKMKRDVADAYSGPADADLSKAIDKHHVH
jgi:imidazolonepropionase-like amidohydrolase